MLIKQKPKPTLSPWLQLLDKLPLVTLWLMLKCLRDTQRNTREGWNRRSLLGHRV